MSPLDIRREPPHGAGVARLLRQAEERSAALYPAESRHGLDVVALAAPEARFFVARSDGRAVGCCAFVPDDAGSAELKSLFVDEATRGLGVGRALLRAVEDAARREGVRRMRLETGVASAEALALYRRHGYRERGPFGAYTPDPLSVFMEKALSRAPLTPPAPSAPS